MIDAELNILLQTTFFTPQITRLLFGVIFITSTLPN
jgi:hypothetical protein